MSAIRYWLCGMAIAVAGCVLYIPFLGNPMVFDDLPFYSGGSFAHAATNPIGLQLRQLPYFTLAFPQVLWGQFPPWNHAELHRAISLIFHLGCGFALFTVLCGLLRVQRTTGMPGDGRAASPEALATMGAVLFVIHPVAVYGAAYLVQRTILMATLFSLLSIAAFMHGMVHRRYGYAIFAAFFYTLGVFSKEHAIVLPAVAILTAPLIADEAKFSVRYGALYLTACVPAAVIVFLLVRGILGTGYEPAFDSLLTQIEGIPILSMEGGPWLVSVVTQMGLFFRYIASWIAPDVSTMSIDMRIDFARTWSFAWIILKVAGFVSFGILGLWLLMRRGKVGLLGFGMLYTFILFTVELTSIRFQEPFVLYRSYLWAPGIILAATATSSILPRKAAIALFAAACLIFLYQAQDRLQSFTSNLALWQDAAAKLPEKPVPLGSRVLFGMAREQVYAGRSEEAVRTAERCITEYPKTWHCNFSRGAIDVQLGRYPQALAHLNRAAKIEPKMGVIHLQRGIALEKLGRLEEARDAYRQASRVGFIVGDYRLDLLDNPEDTGRRTIYDASRSVRREGGH